MIKTLYILKTTFERYLVRCVVSFFLDTHFYYISINKLLKIFKKCSSISPPPFKTASRFRKNVNISKNFSAYSLKDYQKDTFRNSKWDISIWLQKVILVFKRFYYIKVIVLNIKS